MAAFENGPSGAPAQTKRVGLCIESYQTALDQDFSDFPNSRRLSRLHLRYQRTTRVMCIGALPWHQIEVAQSYNRHCPSLPPRLPTAGQKHAHDVLRFKIIIHGERRTTSTCHEIARVYMLCKTGAKCGATLQLRFTQRLTYERESATVTLPAARDAADMPRDHAVSLDGGLFFDQLSL